MIHDELKSKYADALYRFIQSFYDYFFNNKHDVLRYKMNELNYKVDYEIIIKEKDMYYNLIVFIPGNNSYSEEELLLGTNHKDNIMYKEWKEYLLSKYREIEKSSKDKNNKINNMIKILTH